MLVGEGDALQEVVLDLVVVDVAGDFELALRLLDAHEPDLAG